MKMEIIIVLVFSKSQVLSDRKDSVWSFETLLDARLDYAISVSNDSSWVGEIDLDPSDNTNVFRMLEIQLHGIQAHK